ncbi:MAG TPA: hypothetical protein VFS65_00710 [Candidatus Saccharimonadales bacterium]|nr:hypothetical protein [Candidatus Saccharimonadales bacterium]
MRYASIEVLDGGLDAIMNGAIRMLLLKTYAANDPYATVVSNAICSVPITSANFSKSGADGAARVLTLASGLTGSATAGSGASPDLHIAFTNNVDTVFLVTDETTNQVITAGNDVVFPQIVYTSSQPAAA